MTLCMAARKVIPGTEVTKDSRSRDRRRNEDREPRKRRCTGLDRHVPGIILTAQVQWCPAAGEWLCSYCRDDFANRDTTVHRVEQS